MAGEARRGRGKRDVGLLGVPAAQAAASGLSQGRSRALGAGTSSAGSIRNPRTQEGEPGRHGRAPCPVPPPGFVGSSSIRSPGFRPLPGLLMCLVLPALAEDGEEEGLAGVVVDGSAEHDVYRVRPGPGAAAAVRFVRPEGLQPPPAVRGGDRRAEGPDLPHAGGRQGAVRVRSRKGIAAPGLARPHAARSSTIVSSTSSWAVPSRAGGRRSLSLAAVRGSRTSSTHHAAAARRDQPYRSSKRPALR